MAPDGKGPQIKGVTELQRVEKDLKNLEIEKKDAAYGKR
jgi:hypothetical protein